MAQAYQNIITLEPGKRSGKPTIRGMRVTITTRFRISPPVCRTSRSLDDFPYLTEEDIQACLAYAADREARPERHILEQRRVE